MAMQYDAEKHIPPTIERSESDDSQTTLVDDARLNAFTPAEQRKIVWRVDRRLVVMLGFMYCCSLMDRTNLGIAAIAGMSYDLNLMGSRYSIIVLVFFITCVLLQPVVVVALRKVGPRIFLPSITILWGVTTICFAFVTSWEQLVPLRLLLGVFEAGFFPGGAYLLSCWYARYELQKRNAVYYMIGTLASAFAGILSFGFSQMNGLGDLGSPVYSQHYGPTKADLKAPSGVMEGIAGWRWIFIMEGILTVVIALVSALLICDFPEKQAGKQSGLAIRFLSPEEASFIVAKIEHDRKDASLEPFSIAGYLKNALDPKIWLFAAIFGLTTTVTYAIAFFLPIILQQGMGFSVGTAQCLIAPPYVLAAIVMFVCAWLGDKYRLRGPLIIFNATYGIIGLALLGFASNVGVRYFGVFLATAACNANVPAIITFQANNIRGQWKRALGSATIAIVAGIGGIIGSTVFRSQDAPAYRPGLAVCIAASVGVIALTGVLDIWFVRANRRAEKCGKIIEGLEDFRYTL